MAMHRDRRPPESADRADRRASERTTGPDRGASERTAGPDLGAPESAVRLDRRPRAATINDVAAAAGVSRQTVTRAMNGLPEVSVATRQRVLDAASALHYRPNRAAQRLVRGRDVTIGFVVGDLRNPYYPELASELTRRAAERDWGVLVADVEGPGGAQRVESIAARVDVVIGHLEPGLRDLVTTRVPTVLLAEDDATTGACVRFVYDSAMDAAVRHLVDTGRTQIAMIDVGERRSARGGVLRAALTRHGLVAAGEVFAGAGRHSDSDSGAGAGGTSGADAALRLLEIAPRVDAVLCFNDMTAVSALKGFARCGVRVPEDVAVVGVDGLDLGALVTPAITTLAVDMGELAADALDLADALLRGEPAGSLRRTVAHTLVLRESA
jgi:LacI family transcriptional regulator